MKPKKHAGGVKARVAAREEAVIRQFASLKQGTMSAEAKQEAQERAASLHNIASTLRTRYPNSCIRDISTFNRSLRTKDAGKIRLLVATHLFGRYKVPSYLQDCWYVDEVTRSNDQAGWRHQYGYGNEVGAIVSALEIELRRKWFITVASGGSLYKERLKGILTKNEVHAFLNCPIPCNFREALIYAVASQIVDDIGILTRVMKSKLSEKAGINWLGEKVWREIIHFYCVTEELTLSQMNDFIDYFNHVTVRGARMGQEYSLKGRTLTSLTRQMQDWHWELARVKKMGDAKWEGLPVENLEFQLNGYPNLTWTITQLKTSKELAAEGTAMHHCVYGYQPVCVNGSRGIFSVKCLNKKKSISAERALTLEITENGEVVQIRGFANRQAKPEELEAVQFWARKERLTIRKGW